MPRASRKPSEGDFYHVFARGVGRQFIFEDDEDRKYFLTALGKHLDEYNGSLLAWVLMENHFHLLLRVPINVLSTLMKDVQAVYAQHFNRRHGRVGHLFQGRFGSQSIENDEQLLACVRYIHRNPVSAGLCAACDYKWSSYRGYLQGAAVTNTDYILEMLGGVEAFIRIHESWDVGQFEFIDADESENEKRPKGLTDVQANEIAVSLFGIDWRETTPGLPKPERNARLRQLKGNGLSVRQIERFTGLGRNIIQRA